MERQAFVDSGSEGFFFESEQNACNLIFHLCGWIIGVGKQLTSTFNDIRTILREFSCLLCKLGNLLGIGFHLFRFGWLYWSLRLGIQERSSKAVDL